MKNSVLMTIIAFFLLPLPTAWGQNLLLNPGFENWVDDSTCQYWYTETTGFDAVKESGIVHSGTFSAKLILRSTSTQRFTQYVAPINPANDYNFSFWCFDNDQYGRARVNIRWYDGTGGFINGYYGDYSSDSTEWQQLLSGPQGAPALAETAHVEIRLYDVSGFTDSALIYVDDAYFEDLGSGTPPETLSIYEIQGQATSSPWENSAVVTYGIVSGVYGNDFFIEEQPGGPWHGIYVYGSSTAPARGDSVRITGMVTEYFGMTELTGPLTEVLSSGASIPGPTVLQTGSVPVEDYESSLVRVTATCTDDSLGNGEWELDDSSGPVRIDDMGVSYIPVISEVYTVTGPLNYSFGNFKIEPRDSNDIVLGGGVSETNLQNKNFSLRIFPTLIINSVSVNLSVLGKVNAEISIYGISGRKIATLVSKELNRGRYTFAWNSSKIPPGIYYIKANLQERTITQKVIKLR